MKARILVSVLILSGLFITANKGYACGTGNSAPTAFLTANPQNVAVDCNTILDGSDSYDSDGYIVKYEWDFTNDGSYDYYETSSHYPDGAFDGNTPHAYSRAGTYTAKLRVTDNNGRTNYNPSTCNVYVLGVNNTAQSTWYFTIQAAIDNANDDEIVVHPDIYYEDIDFKGKAITLSSTDPTDWGVVAATVIDANDSDANAITFKTSEDADSILRGFTITGGGRGIYCSGASPTISNCVVRDNNSNGNGGGMYNCSNSSAAVTNCFFVENDADCGGGMYNVGSLPTVTNCVFIENNANCGGGIYDYNCSPEVFNCTFSDNSADDDGGGMYNYGALSEPDLTNCIFWGNDAVGDGSEIFNSGSADPYISYCDIEGCGGSGGGWDPNFGTDGGGNIDEDPIFVARVPDDIVSYWEFDEGSGADANDSAGDNHGTLYGDPDWIAGKVGSYALDFDGDGDYVEIPDDDSLTPSNKITIAFWLYNRGGQDAGIYKIAACPSEPASPGASRAYFIEVIDGTGKLRLRIYAPGDYSDDIYSNSVVTLNQWHHIAGTFDQGEAAVYIDGQLDNSDTMSVSSIWNDALPLIVGGYWEYCGEDSFLSRLNGKADDVRIYDRALSAGEIRQLYLDGLGSYHLSTDSPCINRGDPDGSYSGQTDIDGESRVMGGIVDMGADEVEVMLWFVDVNAPGNDDGTSWEDAFNDLQDALAVADYGDGIWVAAGTYNLDEMETFNLVDGVGLYGGFPPGGGNWNGRNPNMYETILTGGYEVYKVVRASNVGETTIIDGFTISDGIDEGIRCENNGSPTIKNNKITGNYLGIYCSNSDAHITNCTIEDNVSYAIYCGSSSDPHITNCIIKNNSEYGIYCYGGVPIIKNNFISGYDGKGIYLESTGEGAVIRNNTIVYIEGEGIHLFEGTESPISNCIIRGEKPLYDDDYDVTYSCIEGETVYPGTGNINSDPCFVEAEANNYHLMPDSLCIDAGNGDYPGETDIDGQPRVIGDSVDMGADEYDPDDFPWREPEIIYVDKNATGGNNGSSWANAYTDIQNALASALMGDEIWVASTDVNDPYVPGDRVEDSFQLKNTVALYGGFNGTETSRDQRDWTIYATVLSGNINNPEYDGDNCYNVVKGANRAVLDGFTITGGTGDGGIYCGYFISPIISNCVITGNSSIDGDGGGVYNYSASPTIINCTIIDNIGSGIYNDGSSPKIINCVIADNEKTEGFFGGGGMSNWCGSPEVTNCVFSGNFGWSGGGMHNGECYPKLTNCTFIGNNTDGQGGGMYNYESSPIVTNCIFWDNNSVGDGNEIYNDDSNPVFGYSDIKDSGGSDNWDVDFGIDLGGNIDADPCFVDAGNPDGNDGIFRTFDDGLRLNYRSPCVDTADGDAAPSRDILGFRRCKPNYVDIGAYECTSGRIVVMCWIDESTAGSGYHVSPGGKERFDSDLADYRNVIEGIIVKSGCLVPPHPSYLGDIRDVLPIGYEYDPNDPPEGITVEEFPRTNPVPTLDDFINHFDRIREGVVPDYLCLSVDNSGSMKTSTINPSPEYPYKAFKNWVADNYPNVVINARDQESEPEGWGDERWVAEINRQISCLEGL